jgi:hypothetical protein
METEETKDAAPGKPVEALPKPAQAPRGEPLQPQVVEEPSAEDEEDQGTFVSEPARLIRIASMTRAMLDEVRQAELDEAGRGRLLQIYASSLDQLRDSLSEDLADELDVMFRPFEGADVSESELRIVQAQLVGWLEGLFHGIQASIFSQQAAAAAQLEEMRRRLAIDAAPESGGGQYL